MRVQAGVGASRLILATLAALMPGAVAWAQTTWDGGGAADTGWGTAANWNNDTLPAFDGTDSLTVTAGFGVNKALTLGADRSIGRITLGGGATSISVSGNTLRLNSTTTSAGAGTALWNANTADGVAATINANILLQASADGTYTGHFRENNNSSGGTWFYGTVTEATGQDWTVWCSRASARGQFIFANAGNSFAALRNKGADVYSAVPGAFGGAALTLEGAATGTRDTAHYGGAAAVNNSVTLAANSTWNSQIETRLTGTLTQSTYTLSYGNSGGNGLLTRLEWSALSGSGPTLIQGSTIAPADMGMFSSGTLNVGDSASSAGQGVLVLSGASGQGVPTWADLIAARTCNLSGGSGTWRINVPAGTGGNLFLAGGFAARGVDLTIPHQGAPNAGGLTDAVFTRNFMLGTQATLGGVRYATNAVIVETDIAYGSQALGTRRYFAAAHNAGLTKSASQWVLAGPVHELAGVISGSNIILYPVGTATTGAGMIRISNPANSLTGTSVWLPGASRSNFSTLGGTSITAPGNMGDVSNIILIFTSDAAFGGASEVEVGSRSSSGTGSSSMLLLEDANAGGSTTFDRDVNVVSTSESTGAAGFGSYAGDVVYTGSVTLGGSMDEVVLHVQDGAMTWGTPSTAAAIVNNRSVSAVLNKSGPGTLRVTNLARSGSAAVAKWNVYAGTLLYNNDDAYTDFDVHPAGTLGGSGTIDLGAATLTLDGTATETAAINPGDGIGTLSVTGKVDFADNADLVVELSGTTADQLVVNGDLDLTALNDRLVLRKLASVTSGTYTIVRYTGSLLSFGNANTDLWQFSSVANEAELGAYELDYGTGSNSEIKLTVKGDASGTIILLR